MNSLVRSTTSTYSRRLNGYEPLHPRHDGLFSLESPSRKMFSKSRIEPQALLTSLSRRRARAKQRQLFLKSYRLSSGSKLKRSKSSKLKKVVVKVRTVVLSLVSFMRFGAFRSCNARPAIHVSSPMRPAKCC
ncbi:hypothetical protein K2173_003587 [Erythroxylum novogranatense]|uniref:Ribosomal protein S14 n=1 Tax=Erythroxylum novogranatense TaxID=1862640 RepID=A0AAV8TBZ0_9ROSI|nr:hypothetical protein K2173_003587 [Erythroxylum novogranatense]